ncbi:MAG: hypothetical protein QM758_26970 [Armatimonas sp.]
MMEEQVSETTEAPAGATNSGHVIGVPGPVVENVGTLDLRGATPEAISTLQKVKNTGTVLVSPESRTHLSGVSMENVGSVLEVDMDEKMLVGPSVELDGAAFDGMADGQKLIIVGILSIGEDVTVEQVNQKLARLRLTGILMAPKSVIGALTGRMEHTGVSVALPKTGGSIIRNMGEKRVTPGYLSYLKPDSLYVNIGETVFDEDVPVALVQEKIAAYVNVGETVASQEILDYLDARCESNVGEFHTPRPPKNGEGNGE